MNGKTYIKTAWVDNQTPVNAANLNKIETAISDLTANAVGTADLVPGNGINMNTTADKRLEVSVADNVQTSMSCAGIEVIVGDPVSAEANKMYYVLDAVSYKLVKIVFNGFVIYEVE